MRNTTLFNRLARMQMENKKNHRRIIQNVYDISLKNRGTVDPEEFTTWIVFVNEDKKTVVMVSPSEKKYIQKPREGDDFSVVKGMALAAFEENMGIRYQELRKLTELFAETTDKCDPAMNIILRYFYETTGLTEKRILKWIEECPVGNDGNKKFLIQIPLITSIEEMIAAGEIVSA